jgi:hypothetical protein
MVTGACGSDDEGLQGETRTDAVPLREESTRNEKAPAEASGHECGCGAEQTDRCVLWKGPRFAAFPRV